VKKENRVLVCFSLKTYIRGRLDPKKIIGKGRKREKNRFLCRFPVLPTGQEITVVFLLLFPKKKISTTQGKSSNDLAFCKHTHTQTVEERENMPRNSFPFF
jgi:hypothetical protein